MTEAAGKALETQGDTIAESLYQGLLNGDASLAKLLFALAEGQIDCEDEAVVGRFCSLAEKLAKEKQWTGTESEEEAEASFGQGEPGD